MTEPATRQKREGWRYSPLPRTAYREPAKSSFLVPLPAWNLAWLSHPFDSPRAKAHPTFTTAVWYTLQTRLSDGVVDMVGNEPKQNTLYSFFVKPPEEAVACVAQYLHHRKLPLYSLLGDEWLVRMHERLGRSRLTNPEDDVISLMSMQPDNFNDARSYLEKFTLRP